jgi:phosphoribosylglycinamide formyltransferase 1
LNVAVLASGGGSNLQALMDRLAGSAARIRLVVSDRAQARALERGRAAGVPSLHVAGDDTGAALLAALRDHGVDFIALAGYLRLVPAAVVQHFRGRIINVHPSLLPAFGGAGMYGLRVHAAVLAAGCRVSGVTVHHVDERYDEGGIIAQWPVPVSATDTPETLAARVLRVEHLLYPAVLRTIAEGRHEPHPAGHEIERAWFRLGTAETVEGEMMAWTRSEGVS